MSALRLVSSEMAASAAQAQGRAQALLGDRPTLILVADAANPDSCCTARLVRRGDVWLGVVSDRAQLTDRIRLGMTPRFLVSDANVVTVQGTAKTRVLGRLHAQSVEIQQTVASLLGNWTVDDDVVIEVTPQGMTVVDDEDVGGAIPRT